MLFLSIFSALISSKTVIQKSFPELNVGLNTFSLNAETILNITCQAQEFVLFSSFQNIQVKAFDFQNELIDELSMSKFGIAFSKNGGSVTVQTDLNQFDVSFIYLRPQTLSSYFYFSTVHDDTFIIGNPPNQIEQLTIKDKVGLGINYWHVTGKSTKVQIDQNYHSENDKIILDLDSSSLPIEKSGTIKNAYKVFSHLYYRTMTSIKNRAFRISFRKPVLAPSLLEDPETGETKTRFSEFKSISNRNSDQNDQTSLGINHRSNTYKDSTVEENSDDTDSIADKTHKTSISHDETSGELKDSNSKPAESIFHRQNSNLESSGHSPFYGNKRNDFNKDSSLGSSSTDLKDSTETNHLDSNNKSPFRFNTGSNNVEEPKKFDTPSIPNHSHNSYTNSQTNDGSFDRNTNDNTQTGFGSRSRDTIGNTQTSFGSSNRDTIADTRSSVGSQNRENIDTTQTGIGSKNRDEIADRRSSVGSQDRNTIDNTQTSIGSKNRDEIADRRSSIGSQNRENIDNTQTGIDSKNRDEITDTRSSVGSQDRDTIDNTQTGFGSKNRDEIANRRSSIGSQDRDNTQTGIGSKDRDTIDESNTKLPNISAANRTEIIPPNTHHSNDKGDSNTDEETNTVHKFNTTKSSIETDSSNLPERNAYHTFRMNSTKNTIDSHSNDDKPERSSISHSNNNEETNTVFKFNDTHYSNRVGTTNTESQTDSRTDTLKQSNYTQNTQPVRESNLTKVESTSDVIQDSNNHTSSIDTKTNGLDHKQSFILPETRYRFDCDMKDTLIKPDHNYGIYFNEQIQHNIIEWTTPESDPIINKEFDVYIDKLASGTRNVEYISLTNIEKSSHQSTESHNNEMQRNEQTNKDVSSTINLESASSTINSDSTSTISPTFNRETVSEAFNSETISPTFNRETVSETFNSETISPTVNTQTVSETKNIDSSSTISPTFDKETISPTFNSEIVSETKNIDYSSATSSSESASITVESASSTISPTQNVFINPEKSNQEPERKQNDNEYNIDRFHKEIQHNEEPSGIHRSKKQTQSTFITFDLTTMIVVSVFLALFCITVGLLIGACVFPVRSVQVKQRTESENQSLLNNQEISPETEEIKNILHHSPTGSDKLAEVENESHTPIMPNAQFPIVNS